MGNKLGHPTPLDEAQAVAERLTDRLRGLSYVTHALVAGSVRRQVPVVSDVDIAVSIAWDDDLDVHLPRDLPDIHWTPKGGSATVDGVWVEFYKAPVDGEGATLQFLTGPGDLNVYLRMKAKRRGWKLSQYGLLEGKTRIDAVTGDPYYDEVSIFDALEVPYLEPYDRSTWREQLGT